MDQPDAAAKKLVLDSSERLYESIMTPQRVPMPAEIPHPEKPSRFGINRTEPVDLGKLWNSNRASEAPKLAIEVSPGLHLGLKFQTGAPTTSDSQRDVLGEQMQTRSKNNSLFGGAGLFLEKRF